MAINIYNKNSKGAYKEIYLLFYIQNCLVDVKNRQRLIGWEGSSVFEL